MKIPKSFVAFVFLWPIAILVFWSGYEVTVETIIPARFHDEVMPWELYVYPWGFSGPYKQTGPHITFAGCREEGLGELSGYMQQWPDVSFNTAKFTCSQRCRFRIEGTDTRVCARVEQFNVHGVPVKDNGI